MLDAVGSPRAFLIGHTYASASLACLFAARHPDRTAGLVLAGGTPSYLDRGDGFGLTPEARDAHLGYVAEHWGDPDGIHHQRAMPGPGREEERRREARFERMAMSPAAARAHFEMVFDLDVRAVLPSIKAPTLVVHRTGDRVVSVKAGRYLAEHIDGARLIELPGDEHFWFYRRRRHCLGGDHRVHHRYAAGSGTRPRARHLAVHRRRRIDRTGRPGR